MISFAGHLFLFSAELINLNKAVDLQHFNALKNAKERKRVQKSAKERKRVQKSAEKSICFGRKNVVTLEV